MRTVGLFIVAVLMMAFTIPAYAIIGRPLTPMSYAGVARRTVRRSAYVTSAAVAGAAAATAATVRALPPGCVAGMPCGGIVYHAVYDGPTVVYVAE